MRRRIVTTPDAPASSLFSQAVVAGPFVFTSGLVGIDPATGRLAGDTIEAQARQALENARAVLTAAHATMDDVVEVGVLLARSDDFGGLNDEWGKWFPADPPARYVARLGVDVPGLLVSVRLTAYTG